MPPKPLPLPRQATEGERIARAYLSKLGWAKDYRRTINRKILPAASREKLEGQERQADAMEEEAEAYLSAEYERLKKDTSEQAKGILQVILGILGARHDLGFIGKRIVDRMLSRVRQLGEWVN